ncbi:class I SAM-dependent methyltransferase [Phyllobacterium sp. LjRoot231]|uniref:class I SAM-dependent methyltransferase n=1 Tax=Phyllobacterium sp. LjRoot231 TaxID=3342289 RepID=UPI003ECDF13F
MTEVADHHRELSNEAWLDILKRSIREPVIDGIPFPRFPANELQKNTVGSSNEDALSEACNFYSEMKKQSARLDMPVNLNSRILDFGCSWGRYLRYFWRDVYSHNLMGVDTDPDVLKISQDLKVPGVLSRIEPNGFLPYESASFTHAFSYSVFTHLPENISLHWIAEIARVLKPGGVFVFTVEPPRFIDFVASIPLDAEFKWHRGLRAALGDPDEAREKAERGELVYLPTGGGDYRAADVYGDTVIPEIYARSRWIELFEIVEYIDEPSKFWQAVVIARRL